MRRKRIALRHEKVRMRCDVVCFCFLLELQIMKKQNFFDSTIKLFEDYRSNMIKEKVNGYNSNLSNEVHIRLWQLSFICEKVLHYEEIVTIPPSSKKDLCEQTRLFDECIVFVEAFYFFAWRIITITDHYTKPLPGIRGLKDKAKGVVLIRNNFIEHPENTEEKIFMLSYGWGAGKGPQLKVARSPGQTFEKKDCGFWINAQEFKEGFEELLKKAIMST